jgi:hypothetical protein
VRAYHETAADEQAMGKRTVWVEPLVGEAKDWHGLRRFRLRTLPSPEYRDEAIPAQATVRANQIAGGFFNTLGASTNEGPAGTGPP